jgi:enoyl-CoA hydratase/carnithine racemase
MGVVEIERDGCCAIVRINRPEKRNALSAEVLTGVVLALEECGRDPDLRGIVLTGSEAQFSTGVDLAEATQVTSSHLFAEAWNLWRSATDAIELIGLPVVAAVNGYCLTGGLELALACDYRFAGRNVRMGITSAKIGSVAGIGGTQRLPRLVGRSRAKRMLFTGEFIDADSALQIGLVDELCDVEQTVAAAVALVHAIGECAPLSVAWHKQAVDAGLDMDLSTGLEYERSLCAKAFDTEDRMEGMTAFLESRQPEFKAR